MTSIVGNASSGSLNTGAVAGSSPSVTSMQNQIDTLQRQCADWAGCITTPPTERQKQENIINQQIQALQTKIDRVQQLSSPANVVPPSSSTANIDDRRTSEVLQTQTGINRPIGGATSGSIINISV